MYQKYNKKQLLEIKDKINLLKYDEMHKIEEIKQIKLNGIYIPYVISSYGRVFSVNYMHKKGFVHELKYVIDKDGYKRVTIHLSYKRYVNGVHRLVAVHFIPNNNITKDQVNHKDGIKSNNYYWNLEWTTCKENINHAWDHGLSHSYGINNGNNVYTEKSIHDVCYMLEHDYSFSDITKKTDVSYAMISLIYRGRFWKEISSKYDFSNYSYGKSRKTNVYKACDLLQNTNISIREISNICNISRSSIYKILQRKIYKNISENYNFEKRINSE